VKIFISFVIALFNFGYEFETIQCSDYAKYIHYRFENARCYQADKDWSVGDIS
jgi:hypothetical protein